MTKTDTNDDDQKLVDQCKRILDPLAWCDQVDPDAQPTIGSGWEVKCRRWDSEEKARRLVQAGWRPRRKEKA